MSEETIATTEIATTDLTGLTADQLLALSEEDWKKTKEVFETALKAKGEEKKS